MSEVFSALAASSRDWLGDAASGAMLSATRAFLVAAMNDDALVREASVSLNSQEPGSAAWIALALGNLVERGKSAEVSGPAVFRCLTSWLPDLPAPGNGENAPRVPTPGQAMLLARFQFLCQSVVTHLARLPAERQAMGQEVPLLERLDELGAWSHGAWWVREALLKSSGTLVLLHPASGTGLRLRYTNVSNCFHLFSLLQTAVGTRMPGGRLPAATAQVNEAWWHYGNAMSPRADVKFSIWGEGLVRDIPCVNGEQVVLLWPPILASRVWDAGFLGPHLEAMPADAGVERMLTPDECKVWLETLHIAQKKKRWWPF